MEESSDWLGRTWAKLLVPWSTGWVATLATVLVAQATGLLHPWRGMGVAALLIFAVVYGTVMMRRKPNGVVAGD